MPSCQSFSRGGSLVFPRLLPLFVSLFLFAAPEWSEATAARETDANAPTLSDENQDARAKLIQLRQEIAYHDDLYYNKGAPIISDQAYDALKRELPDLERSHPELAASATATTRLQGDSDGRFSAHRHLAPMLSLEKAYSETDLEAFHQRIQKSLGASTAAYRIEPKIDGLGIPGIGPARSQTLAQGFGSLEALAAFASDENAVETPLPGFGPATAEALRHYFSQVQHQAQLEALSAHGVRPAPPERPTRKGNASVAGKIFVFTGALPSLTRAEATALVESAGGGARSTVSAQTDYLVVGENPGQKQLRARQLNIPQLTEAEFLSLLRL